MPFHPRSDRPPLVINIPNRTPSLDPLRRRVIGWLVALTTAGVLFCGMFPFDFVFHFSTAGDDFKRRFDWTLDQLYTAGDGLENIIFFVPTGFALAALFLRGRRSGSRVWQDIGRAAAMAIPLGAALSSLVESAQVFLQSRDPSLADICSNTTGTAVGFVLFLFIGTTILGALTRAARQLDQWLTPARCGVLALGWLTLAALAPLLFHDAGSLAEWNASFPLLLGNETTGDRWWNGNVNSLWMADRSLSDAELDRVLNGGNVPETVGGALLVNYAFVARGPYSDRTANAGPLHWKAGKGAAEENYLTASARPASQPAELFPPLLAASTSPAAQPLSQSWWLQTSPNALTAPINQIRKSNAFTLICDVQTEDLDQHDGPPRIVSLSAGTTLCNLQLLQEADELVVRLRTTASGEGGSDPEFILPYAFVDTGPRRIVLSYDQDQLMVTTDHLGERNRFRYTAESSLIWKAYPRPGWAFRLDSSGQNICAAIYRVLALLPLGYLLAASLIRRQRRLPSSWKLITWTTSAVVLTEVALSIQNHRLPDVASPLVAEISGLLGMIAAGSFSQTIQKLQRICKLW